MSSLHQLVLNVASGSRAWRGVFPFCRARNCFLSCLPGYPSTAVRLQGFASGSLDEDAFAPRFFVDQGLEIFVSQSYSKNLGLYAERIGAINVIANDKGVSWISISF